MHDDEPPRPAAQEGVRHVSLAEIYWLFFEIGALSFGGGLTAWLYREVAEKRKLMTEADFLGGLTLCQVLPGINMVNMSVFVGQRLRGLAGALAAIFGLVTLPFFAVLVFASLYSFIQSVPSIQHFLDGMAAAAVGMIFAMALKAIQVTRMQRVQLIVVALIALTVGALRWPMIPVILVLAPISVWLAWPKEGKTDA